MLLSTVAVCAAAVAGVAAAKATESFIIEKQFESITCGSSIKLAHLATGYRLHSHEVKYGTGSGQQSVTGFPKGDDPNSYFVVYEAFSSSNPSPCLRGRAIRCGESIRLQHLATGKFLHSHGDIPSPISGNQEVSAFDRPDTGDNWKVICVDPKSKFWAREKPIQLEHEDTKRFLGSSRRYQFQNVITGQLEISARVAAKGDEEQWAVQEGVFFANSA
eukprot:jgi/Hompol1/2242/HPOL_005898-RA